MGFRLFICFKLEAWQHFICYFVVDMQDFKKVMKQDYFLEFQIIQGATVLDFQLDPSKFNP